MYNNNIQDLLICVLLCLTHLRNGLAILPKNTEEKTRDVTHKPPFRSQRGSLHQDLTIS